jgi:stage II sporulation protein M
MFWARYTILWWAILGEIVIAVLLVRTGVAYFNREELLGRELDVINLGWGWRIFKEAFTGEARSPLAWYKEEVGSTLQKMRWPLAFMILALALGAWAGAGEASILVLPPQILDLKHMNQGFLQGLESLRFFSTSGIAIVWLHNLRAVFLATILGTFSFGVLGIIVLMLPLMLVGYFMASLAHAGLSPLLFLVALVLPHGILEIPAIVVAGAAIFRLGGSLATPATNGQTIGEAWLRSVADWVKIMLGLVLPLLLGAAFLEVMVTPRLAVLILGG